MHFCELCERVMVRDTSEGFVAFKCLACGVSSNAVTAYDSRIGGWVSSAAETSDMYNLLISTAVRDRTNQLVRTECKQCGLPYQVQLRLGPEETTILLCKSGCSAPRR